MAITGLTGWSADMAGTDLARLRAMWTSLVTEINENIAELALIVPVFEEVTANATIDDATTVVLIDATAGNVTVTLPESSTRQIILKRIDSTENTVTIDADAAETIDGATTFTIADQYTVATIVGDGTGWWKV